MELRLKPRASPKELIEFNKSLIRKYIRNRESFQKAESVFHQLFEEFSRVHHNDQFHGTETLLYHQYMVMHSFDTFMDMVAKDFSTDDIFVNNMENLLQTIEKKTKLGRRELRKLLIHKPPFCSKNLQTLLFLTVLFHDLGKLYNTEKWEKEFEDETFKLRKFQRHDEYGWSFFQILSSKKVHFDKLFEHIAERIKKEIAQLESGFEGLNEKKKARQQQKINLLKIDLHYLILSREKIEKFKDLLDECGLSRNDYLFVSRMIQHHQTLFNDPSMNYKDYIKEKDIKKLKKYLKWAREKKLAKVGIKKRTIYNDYIFYGLMFANMADANGTGFSDHTIELAFKDFKKGDKFQGHHGDIKIDAEFFGFLTYLYHNLKRSDEDIIQDWFGVGEKEKKVQYNWGILFKNFSQKDALNIKLILTKQGVDKGLEILKGEGHDTERIKELLKI